ncbi:MAG: nucleotide pyrophosphohydrolase [Acidobacteria bacterium]|nr:nucleotide pyrophosphohydrolase [Acidobacteriota bacterium]
MDILEELVEQTRDFASRRDWLAHHAPKNLAMAIAGEAGELASEFRWLTIEGSHREQLTSAQFADIRFEMADVFIFLLRLSDVLDVDLAAAVRDKLAVNEDRFPVAPDARE